LNVGDVFQQSIRLQGEIQQTRLDLIWTDLEVCLTLATSAEVAFDMGHREHAEQTVARAEKGYSDMLGVFSAETGLTPEVEGKFQSVRERLDGLRRFR
jgi:hypothetical protein